jgi:hypothetical protein
MKTIALTAAFLAAFSISAFAASPTRIRGTIVSATETTLTVKTTSGTVKSLGIAASTHYVTAAPATRADVQSGKYIGAATKMQNGHLVALEVTIFPPSMTGTGEGHYPWDTIPDTTASGAGEVPSGMTNGSVAAAMPARTTHSSMTNGSVTASQSLPGAVTAAGDRQIVVTYDGGSQTVLLPPTAPINVISPAGRAALTAGAQVFVVAVPGASGLEAKYVVIATDKAKLAM